MILIIDYNLKSNYYFQKKNNIEKTILIFFNKINQK